jgi:hypothetical protein
MDLHYQVMAEIGANVAPNPPMMERGTGNTMAQPEASASVTLTTIKSPFKYQRQSCESLVIGCPVITRPKGAPAPGKGYRTQNDRYGSPLSGDGGNWGQRGTKSTNDGSLKCL